MYKKVSTDMNFVDREKETEKFWEDNHIFEKSMEDREGCPQYMFYDGPPTANGMKFRERPDGILTDCRSSWRLRRLLVLTERIRLKNMVLSHLSKSVKRVCGNTKVCGRISLIL